MRAIAGERAAAAALRDAAGDLETALGRPGCALTVEVVSVEPDLWIERLSALIDADPTRRRTLSLLACLLEPTSELDTAARRSEQLLPPEGEHEDALARHAKARLDRLRRRLDGPARR